ncbi:MAG: ABC transporter substrate-binding protein [Chloroflexales bacterium]|nr:ABC transporter substrate-binding protein [Chloroflexales bacterium]
MFRPHVRPLVLISLLSLALTACGGAQSSTPTAAPTAAAAAPTAPATQAPTTPEAATAPATQAPAAAASPAPATTEASVVTLRVGVVPVPHGEILTYINDNLAAAAGLTLEIVEFSDYVQPNLALADGQLDANFFQHVPYLEDFAKEHNIPLVPVANVHIEPLGIYSRKVKGLDELTAGAVVAIPNDVTNAGRALQLLATNGLLTLREGAGSAATIADITANPKELKIAELEAAQLPRSLDDTAISVINGNYALEVGLTPSTDALALESGIGNPYANVLAVLKGKESDPAIQTLARLLNSPEVKQFIEEHYKGSVLPAF